jgi:hypothetical protein
MQVGWPLKALRRAGTFDPPVAERIRAWGVAGTVARAAAAAVVVFALLYVLVIANPPPEVGGNWRTDEHGIRTDDPSSFLTTILDGPDLRGAPVHRRERVLAHLRAHARREHGPRRFYLLGGYIAYEVQQRMTGSGSSCPGRR